MKKALLNVLAIPILLLLVLAGTASDVKYRCSYLRVNLKKGINIGMNAVLYTK